MCIYISNSGENMGAVFPLKGELTQLLSFLEAEYSSQRLTRNRLEGPAGRRKVGALWGECGEEESGGVEEPEAGLPTHLFPSEPLSRNNRHSGYPLKC